MSKKIFVPYSDLVKNRTSGRNFETQEEADKWIESPSTDSLEVANIIRTRELLNIIAQQNQEILEAHKKFYQEMMHEKLAMKKLKE